MTDVRLTQRGSPYEAVTIDFLMTDMGGLDTSQELATAATVALLTDARADEDDVLPDPNSDDRRGWWGNTDAQEIWDGWPIGSRLWLLSREKITPVQARVGSLTARIEAYIREALEPMLQRKIATGLDVDVVRAGINRIEASIVMTRGRDEIDLRFSDLWRGIIVEATGV